MTTQARTKFDVGGVELDRPFKVRRLGHFGYNLDKMEECLHFYRDLLGFQVTDEMDWSGRVQDPKLLEGLGPHGAFFRFNTDHHALVLFNRKVLAAMRGGPGAMQFKSEIDINQITWQVGSLEEVVNAGQWLTDEGVRINRMGRDMPGSNWHTYFFDPDGHTNELYYGMEQIGWQGHSKPRSMYYRRFGERPELPQINESQEVADAEAKGIDILSGYRPQPNLEPTYNVNGVLLPRPFKVVRLSPIGLFVDDVKASQAFYEQHLGFTTTEEASIGGAPAAFLRANTEHHILTLLSKSARTTLGMSPDTTSAFFGVQLANYRQLKDAISFLRDHGVRVDDNVSAELHPSVDYAAHAFDPEGHCVLLYYYMEQIGWDGKPRPQAARRKVTPGVWPETLEALPDSFGGEPYLGPWG